MNCWKDLNKNAASGVDKVTAEAYGENLEANIQALVERLKRQTVPRQTGAAMLHSKGKRKRKAAGNPGT